MFQNVIFQEKFYIPQSGIRRALGQFCIFAAGEVSFEIIKQPVDDRSLALVEDILIGVAPHAGLDEH